MQEIKTVAKNIDNVWAEVDECTAIVVEKTDELIRAKRALSDAVKDLMTANGGNNLVMRNGKVHTVMFRRDFNTYYLRAGKAGRPAKAKKEIM